ncbi:MAG TPA: universal stress protein [Anaerolineales bacterium]|nr:universal stress protein [Anaerolineales bacterium]HRQ91275.1 universal stress protein [Anaerolineales bacterium]
MNNYSSAMNDFKRARGRAALRKLLSRLGGRRDDDLLRFDDVRKMLGGVSQLPRGLHEIPLDAIVGSVGRYEDFNRQFLPRQANQGGRWACVRMAVEGQGLPPIEVYKIGDIYFVLDGHHRVSVARDVGAKSIEAFVTEIPTAVSITPADDLEDLILKAELHNFLQDTQLGQTRPDVDFHVTIPGRINELREHIAVHRYYMGQEQQREVPVSEAAAHWADEVYVPALHAIRQLALLRDFPQRTEADMYLWLMKHRSTLEKELGWSLNAAEAAAHAWNRLEGSPRRVGSRLRRWLSTWLPVAAPPLPTEWRLQREDLASSQVLFPRLLVPLSGEDSSWTALDVAIEVAQREHSELRGVHVLPDGKSDSDALERLRGEFERHVSAAGLRGTLVVEKGNIHRRVEARSHWSDLVVLHLKHAPGTRVLERLLSGLRTFLQRSPRPVLVVPAKTALRHALLAYDGSRKARQALYLAAYLAERWRIQLTVVTSFEGSVRPTLSQTGAKNYLLARGIYAEYVQRRGRAAQVILDVAAERGCDFVLMGGYAQSGWLEAMRGSNLDVVLREFRGAIWVCN